MGAYLADILVPIVFRGKPLHLLPQRRVLQRSKLAQMLGLRVNLTLRRGFPADGFGLSSGFIFQPAEPNVLRATVRDRKQTSAPVTVDDVLFGADEEFILTVTMNIIVLLLITANINNHQVLKECTKKRSDSSRARIFESFSPARHSQNLADLKEKHQEGV